MRLDIYHHHSFDDEVPSWVESLVNLINRNQETIMAAIDGLQAAVTAEDTVIDSAITLIQGIPALIAAAGVDPTKLAALQSDITSKSQALASAVAAKAATISGIFTGAVHAADVHKLRWTCWAVRKAVAVYGASEVESMARSAGVSEKEIERAKACLPLGK